MEAPEKRPALEPEWLSVLEAEFSKAYMQNLRAFLAEEKRKHPVYPPGPEIFSAFWRTPFSQVRVVILGQDPYHGPNQANGLCFSVRKGITPPPSLENIFRERQNDLGIPLPNHGDLSAWAAQGVLLLNTVLTVRAREANSHKGQGWETFTDTVIDALNTQRDGLIFVLWGAAASQKAQRVDRQRHHILSSAHPSPYSADRGFFGSKPFSKVNALLRAQNQPEIDWTT